MAEPAESARITDQRLAEMRQHLNAGGELSATWQLRLVDDLRAARAEAAALRQRVTDGLCLDSDEPIDPPDDGGGWPDAFLNGWDAAVGACQDRVRAALGDGEGPADVTAASLRSGPDTAGHGCPGGEDRPTDEEGRPCFGHEEIPPPDTACGLWRGRLIIQDAVATYDAVEHGSKCVGGWAAMGRFWVHCGVCRLDRVAAPRVRISDPKAQL